VYLHVSDPRFLLADAALRPSCGFFRFSVPAFLGLTVVGLFLFFPKQYGPQIFLFFLSEPCLVLLVLPFGF